MPRPERQKNPNRCRPKSKGGCARCKQRRRRCDETKPSCQECLRKGFTCPGYQKKPLEWRYVFKDEEQQDGDQAVLSPPEELLPSTLLEQENANVTASQAIQAGQTKELQELWDEANSSLFDQLPDIETSSGRFSKFEDLTNNIATIKDGAESDDSLAVLRRRIADTPIPYFLIQMPAILVQYYFDYVCKAWSSFDSPLNPFRLIVSRLWSRNAAIYYAIQSMAAASLANDLPGMRAIGRQTQQQAIACLRNNPRIGTLHRDNQDDEFFLALLMIGLTTAWHDAADLGLEYLKEAKDHLNKQQQMCQSPDSLFAKQYPLFQQCLLYWNMLAAFVAEDSLLLNEESVLERPDPETSVYLIDGQTLPHPWTGPLSKALRLFYKTARVVRAARISHRTRVDNIDFATFDFDYLVEEIKLRQKAERLEEDILFTGLSSYCGPVDIGDTNTPPAHFIILAEAYRCAGLLQIYHVFPDILDDRLRLNQRFDIDTPALFSVLFPEDSPAQSPEDMRRILALHVVSLLDQLPSTSGTRFMQLVLLTCISSDLVFSNQSVFGPGSNPLACLNTLDVDVAQGRRRVNTRLSELTLIIPKLPMQRVSGIVHEVWDRADSGLGIYWLDLMIERNLETIMG
ncbi:uncharacterized protein N7473_000803 [Penicillium subrubescens]|uniref:Zn(2)-C6 fungal-type domain-containing protein n=1 Tax=Penicillium subrubescens TaxID=1316194 RepID=A0A1Q5T0R9_9EURO|nr:uncharacterized protein N7473_000803 [Penicillium subrubescens]KAJ5911500.1 hypothetical protein N7473_000803 [Penicillium subrubescens]OKO93766.1 hypothetical protein PENSUB_12045 [Penicillium subrubescens]